MAEYIDVIFKVGDGTSLQDGMPVCYIDPDEWGYQPAYSDHMRKVFAIVRVNHTWLPMMKDVLKCYYSKDPVAGPPEKTSAGVIHKARQACIDFAELETVAGVAGLESSLRGPGTVDVLVLPELSTSFLKDSKTLKARGLDDNNAVTSGSYTVGSSKNYATWSLALADIGTPLTGNLTFTQQTAVTESAAAATTADLGGYKLKCTSDYDHYGDPTRTDRLISITCDAHVMTIDTATSGDVEVTKLYWKVTGTWTTGRNIFRCVNNTGQCVISDVLQIKGGYHGQGIVLAGANQTVLIKNVVMGDSDLSADDIGFRIGSVKNDSHIENVTAQNIGCGIWVESMMELRNCVVIDSNPGYGCFAWASNANGYNNAASDTSCADGTWASGSGNITGKTAVQCFKSTATTDSSYLDIKPDGLLDGAGIASYQARGTCVRNRPVPGPRGYCIGAAEAAKAGMNVIAAVLNRWRI